MRRLLRNDRQIFAETREPIPGSCVKGIVAVEQPLASTSGSLAAAPVNGKRRGESGDGLAEAAEAPASLSFQDQQTLAQLRRGNWSAMEQLVTRYQDRLYVTILRMVNHADDAADLVQETFVRARASRRCTRGCSGSR